MPSIRYSVDSSGAERGARQFSSAIDRIIADARRASQAIEQLDRVTRNIGQTASGVAPAIARITQASQQVQRATQPAVGSVNALSASMRNMSSAAALSFGPLSGLGARFTAIGSLATRNSVALGGVIAAATGVGVAFAEAVRRAADFEQSMLRVGKVTNATTSELKAQSADVLKLSSSLGIPATELAKIEESAARLGIRGSQNLATFAAEIAKLTRTTDLGAGPLADQLAQFLNLTKSAPGEITKVSSALTALGNNFAAGEGKILSMALELSRGASAFDVGSDKLLALAASLAAVGERSERSGTALTQVLIGITQAAAGGKHLEDFARLLGVTNEKFQDLAKQDVGQVFIEVLKRLQQEGPHAIAVLQELQLGSSRNFKVLLTQAQAIDEVSRALGIVRGQYANATATDQEFSRMNEALNRQLEIAGTQIENLGILLGSTFLPALTSALEAVNDFLRSLQGIEAPADAVGQKMQAIANDVVLAVHAFQALTPLLGLTGDLMRGLATADLAGLASAIASIPARFEEVRQASGNLAQDMERLRAGEPLRLFEGAAKDAEDIQAVSGAVSTLTGNVQNATHAPDALSAAMSSLSKSTGVATAAFDKNRDAIDKTLAALDGDIAAKKALATQGAAAAKAQEEINKLTEKGIQVSDADRAKILAKAQALVGWGTSAKAAAKEAKDAAKAMETFEKGIADVQRSLEKDVKLVGLDENQKAVVDLTAKIEELGAKAVESGADEVKIREQVNAAIAAGIPLLEQSAAAKDQEFASKTIESLQREIELRRIEIEQGTNAARVQEILNQAKDEGRKLTDEQVAGIRKEVAALNEIENKSKDAFKGIDDAFNSMLDGLISGTLDFGEIWQSMAASMVKDFADSVGGVSGLIKNLAGGLKGLFTGDAGAKDKDGNPISFLSSIGGGTDRFQNTDGSFNYGAAGAAAAQGGATAYSLFRPTEDTKLEGLIAKGTERGVLSAANGIGRVVGTIVGAVASIYLGPLGGIAGAVVGSGLSALIAGSVDRNTFLKGDYSGFIGVGQDAYNPGKLSTSFLAGIPLAQEAAFTSYKLFEAILNLPSLGLAMRKGAESMLDESETFAALQAKFGDITVRSGGPEGVYRNNLTGGDTARARGWSEAQVDLTKGATAALFGQLAEGEMAEDAGRLGEAMGNIMAEFLSRGMEDGLDFEPMFDALRQFAHEAGIDLFSTMNALDDVMSQSMAAATTWGKLDPFASTEQGARAYAEALVGATEVFKGDFPQGVNLTAIALRNMEKDGVDAFSNLDDEAKDTLQNLTQDTELTMQVVQKLVAQGYTIDTDSFKRQVEAISGSASFIGENIADVFNGPSVFAGIEAMGAKLKETIRGAVFGKATEQLFDTTRIAESFAPVYEVLAQLNDDKYDLTTQLGVDSFRNQMVLAVANGKDALLEYVPQLRAIRDAAAEVDKAIEEALKPTDAEAFWANLSETLKSNKDAIEGMAQGMFEVAVQAERAGAGLGQQATRDAMSAQIDQGIYSATQAAVSTTAGESEAAQRLAALTTEFQFKVQAALEGGITQAELADLTALKARMYEAGQEVADGIAASTKDLEGLFNIDRVRDSITAAAVSLKDSVGTAAGAMFDAIKNGGSAAEGSKAFGESFRNSVRDNILAGMQEALVQSAIMEGALATQMGALKEVIKGALVGGITDEEQAVIDQMIGNIKTTTDSTLAALQPTIDRFAQTAVELSGGTDKAAERVNDLTRDSGRAAYGVDEMGRRAAKALEGVEEAVPPATVQGVADGMSALKAAVGEEAAAGDIKAGMDALVGAVGLSGAGGAPDDIKKGLDALRDAFGPDASPEEIGAGLEKIKAAFDAQKTDEIAQGVGAIHDALGADGATGLLAAVYNTMNALGAPGTGLAGAADTIRDALGEGGAAGAANDTATTFREVLQPATDDVADSLRTNFVDGLTQAENAARSLAEVLNSVGSIPGRANGGPVPAGTMAFVGERGPELILAHPGGGVSVMPIDGIPGYADGTGDLIGISPRNTGPFGHPRVPPPPAPPRQSASTDDSDLRVKLNIEAHLEEFFKTGDFATFSEQFEQSVNESVAKGIMSAILETGPLKTAMDKFNSVLSSEIEKAWADGSLSDEELANIRTKMAELGGPIKDIVKTLGPEVEALFADLGLGDSVGSDLRSALGSAFRDFASSGDLEGAKEAVRQAFNEATMNGIVDALLMEGPIADAIENASTGFSDAMREALADGVISEDEADRLKELGADLGANLEAAFAGLDPAITALFDGMRDRAAESMAQAGDLIGGSLKSLLNDPANLNFASFSEALRGDIYQSVAGGLIDAFIQSAVIQGALAPMLASIQLIFDQIGNKQLTIAEANGLIAEQVGLINGVLADPTFKATMDTLITSVSDIGQNLNAFPPAARDVANSATDVQSAVTDAQKDVCDGACALKEKTIDLGQTILDSSGRAGDVQDIVFEKVPKFAAGGLVTRPTIGLIGEAGPEMVIPLDMLRGFAAATGVDPSILKELEAARGAFDSIIAGKDSAVADAVAALSDAAQGALSAGTGSPLFDALDDLRADLPLPAARSGGEGSNDSELADAVAEMSEELRELRKDNQKLREALAEQPIIVNGEVKVGMNKVLDVLFEAKRTGKASGNDVFGGK